MDTLLAIISGIIVGYIYRAYFGGFSFTDSPDYDILINKAYWSGYDDGRASKFSEEIKSETNTL
jgi:hypothetical protein